MIAWMISKIKFLQEIFLKEISEETSIDISKSGINKVTKQEKKV